MGRTTWVEQPVACIHVWYRQAVHASLAPSARVHVRYRQGVCESYTLALPTNRNLCRQNLRSLPINYTKDNAKDYAQCLKRH